LAVFKIAFVKLYAGDLELFGLQVAAHRTNALLDDTKKDFLISIIFKEIRV